jgi:cytochrome P450
VIIYRTLLCPLATHKGRFFARVTSWPNWYHAAKGDRHIWLLRLHAQYGSAVRFSPNSVSFNTLSAVDSIYTPRDAKVCKGDWYQCVKDFAYGDECTITARDKTRHALKRRILSHTFSERALREYEHRIRLLTGRWLQQLTRLSGDGRSVDFGAWSNYIVFDILGDLCYSKDFGLIQSEENRHAIKLLPRTTRSWYNLGYFPWSHPLRYLLFKTVLKSSLGHTFTRDNSEFREFCITALMERVKIDAMPKKPDSVSHDMFHHLLRAKDPETGAGFSMPELGAESMLLMIAGTHTTSMAVAAAVFYLSKNNEQLNKVATEIRAASSSIKDMDYRQLAVLPYLRACINETLRMCPPTAGHLQREVLAEGTEVDGIFYPAVTNVGVSAYALQRSSLVWKDPRTFRPERWLQDDGKHLQSNLPGLFAFSSGPLGCPGKQLAYMEMTIILAMLISHFDMTLNRPDADKEDYVIQDCFVGQGQGPRIVLQPHSA